MLAGVPASGLLGSRAARGVILYDLRFELRPEQFSTQTRVARKVSWLWSMRLAEHIFTISDRSLDDLRTLHPALAGRARTAQLGSDHALRWERPETTDRPYAIAFGHFGNKNADAVIAGWAKFSAEHPAWLLRLVGMSSSDRAAATDMGLTAEQLVGLVVLDIANPFFTDVARGVEVLRQVADAVSGGLAPVRADGQVAQHDPRPGGDHVPQHDAPADGRAHRPVREHHQGPAAQPVRQARCREGLGRPREGPALRSLTCTHLRQRGGPVR